MTPDTCFRPGLPRRHPKRAGGRGALLAITLLSWNWLLAGCRIPPPPVRQETPVGVVFGNSREEVAHASAWFEMLHARIRELLPDTRDHEVELWVQKELGIHRFEEVPAMLDGFVNQRGDRIRVRSGVECVEQTIAHELVHALLSESWALLPSVVEEGLCEAVAMQTVSGCASRLRTKRLFGAAFYLGEVSARASLIYRPSGSRLLSIQIPAHFATEREDLMPPLPVLSLTGNSIDIIARGIELNHYHYGFGMWIVERIVERHGYEGLLLLCREARRDHLEQIPPERLLEAAELGPPESWQLEILESLGEEDLRWVVLENQRSVTTQAARWLRHVADEGGTADAILERCQFTFRLDGVDREISLLDLPEIRTALLHALDGFGSPGV